MAEPADYEEDDGSGCICCGDRDVDGCGCKGPSCPQCGSCASCCAATGCGIYDEAE